MHVALTVVNGIHKGQQIPITRPTFLIGRGKHCHLRPTREDVGREHCAIVVQGERVLLRDYGSTNGTILNRRTLVEGEVPVSDGDVFDVGPLQFKLAIRPEPIRAAAPAGDDDDSCFNVNDIFTGQPSEHEPGLDSTIQISKPDLVKPARRPPLSDENEKLY
ncbi:MAG: FHA domain-containing protein [Gemmataceae bacterium]|nr:FHA domain-containing protein [Gemmataceae bacterium]